MKHFFAAFLSEQDFRSLGLVEIGVVMIAVSISFSIGWLVGNRWVAFTLMVSVFALAFMKFSAAWIERFLGMDRTARVILGCLSIFAIAAGYTFPHH